MKRREWLGLAALVALSGGLAACREAPLRVAAHPWIGYESLFLARDLGWLPAYVHLQETLSASDSMQALREGRVDAAGLTLDELLRLRSEKLPLSMIAVLDVSAGADVVMAGPAIDSLADLKGRRIALEASAVGEIMLIKLLEAAEIRRHEVRLLSIEPENQLAAWRKGEIDVAITYEPTASRLAEAGGHAIFDSRRVPETIFDVLAVRTELVRNRPAACEALLQAHFRGIEHLRVNRQDAMHRIAARQGIGIEAVRKSLGGVVIPDLERNRLYFREGSELVQAIHQLSRLMSERRMLPKDDDALDLWLGDCLPRSLS